MKWVKPLKRDSVSVKRREGKGREGICVICVIYVIYVLYPTSD